MQGFFLADRIKQLAATDPSVKERQPFKALLEHDHKTLHSLGKQGLMELFFATHAGMSDEQFHEIARAWFASARHPKFGRPFTAVTYEPQVELLGYLRENGFKTYIVSGGGIDFIRVISAAGLRHSARAGDRLERQARRGDSRRPPGADEARRARQLRRPRGEGAEHRPAHRARPILAFGNSDGDLAMLRYTKAGPGARLALLLHHDDAEREVAYDREFRVSPLVEALDKAEEYGITRREHEARLGQRLPG